MIATGCGLALFIGSFSLLNLVGSLAYPLFDTNHWWIDLRPMQPWASRAVLAAAAVLLVAYALRPRLAPWRHLATIAAATLLCAAAVSNTLAFHLLAARGGITAGCPVAFSLFVALALLLILLATCAGPAGSSRRRLTENLLMWLVVAVCLFAFPLAQMVCFGRTDYRRPADAIVVFGARVYADGRVSDALADRVRTACCLYHEGLASTIILSGGPGDGPIHETEGMRRLALRLGVPDSAILTDRQGLSTQATVNNTTAMFAARGNRRVLAVSHFYHLPRIKMTYQRQGWEVYTVPADESYPLTDMPLFMLREVAALWAYYLRPLCPA